MAATRVPTIRAPRLLPQRFAIGRVQPLDQSASEEIAESREVRVVPNLLPLMATSGQEIPCFSLRANDWVAPVAVRASDLLISRVRPENRRAVLHALPFIVRVLGQRRRDHGAISGASGRSCFRIEARTRSHLAKNQEWQTAGHLIGTLLHEPRQSVAVSFGPPRVVPAHAGDHSIGRRRKPAAEVLIQVTEPLREVLIGAAAEMNVRRLSTHQPQ